MSDSRLALSAGERFADPMTQFLASDSVHPQADDHLSTRMPRKPKPPPDDPEQSKRFIDMAREVGAENPAPISSACSARSRSSPKARLLKPLPNRAARVLADLRGKAVHKIADLVDRAECI